MLTWYVSPFIDAVRIRVVHILIFIFDSMDVKAERIRHLAAIIEVSLECSFC